MTAPRASLFSGEETLTMHAVPEKTDWKFQVRSFLLNAWLTTRRECLEIARATWAQTIRLLAFAREWKRGNSLARKVAVAKQELGEKAFREEIGDPLIRQRITSIDEHLEAAGTGWLQKRSRGGDRQRLVLELAEAIMTNPEQSSGVSIERNKVRKAEAALAEQRSALTAERNALRPPDRTTWRRVSLGYALSMYLFAVLITWATSGGPTIQARDSESPSLTFPVHSSKAGPGSLAGKWETDDDTNTFVAVEFRNDNEVDFYRTMLVREWNWTGQGPALKVPAYYTITGPNTLEIRELLSGRTELFQFAIQGDSLTLTNSLGTQVFHRRRP
jgi:hypothetical protein